MLRPIPSKILKSTAIIRVCNGIDRYQNQTYQTLGIERVHCQPSNSVRKSIDNTDYVCSAVLFIDERISKPHNIDYMLLFKGAHDIGGDMRVNVNNRDYTVAAVEELRDDTDRVHHWELYLV